MSAAAIVAISNPLRQSVVAELELQLFDTLVQAAKLSRTSVSHFVRLAVQDKVATTKEDLLLIDDGDAGDAPKWLQVLEPALRDVAVHWSTAQKRRMAKIYARWAAQLLESAEIFDDLQNTTCVERSSKGVTVRDPAAN